MICNQDIPTQVLVEDAFYNTGGGRGAYQTHLLGVPRRLSWSHRGDLCPPAPLTRLPAPACMSPELRAFTALCGGVDSRDRPAAAAGGDDVGEEGER